MLIAADLTFKLTATLVPNPDKPTPQMVEYVSGFLAAIKAAMVSNAVGTIVGLTAPGAPLANGAGTGGVITIQPAPMIAKTTVGQTSVAVTNIRKENEALINYIATGTVTFASGTIAGTCTNTPTNPGPLILGTGTGGVIVGLTGAGAMAAVAGATGYSGPAMITHYSALIDYLLLNAEVSYASGLVTGVCPIAGGALTLGAASGGIIS